jgi:low temperature requirement protein LtrA
MVARREIEVTAHIWRPPRLRTTEEREDRHATWLELFFDLVFVVAVAQLASLLSHDLTWTGLGRFMFLYAPLWWSWAAINFYQDRFDTDDVGQRIIVLLQMLAVAGVAASTETALGTQSEAFASSYAAVRLLLVFSYYRVAKHIPEARPLARRFVGVFSATASMWLISILLPEPFRYWAWGLALAAELGMALHRGTRRSYAVLPLSTSHLPERYGLFTIIVLGEAVAGVVAGLTHRGAMSTSGPVAAFGLVTAFSLWWIYFERMRGTVLSELGGLRPAVWLYSHGPLAVAITALGVGIEHAVDHDAWQPLSAADGWLLVGSLAATMATVGVMLAMQSETARVPLRRAIPVVLALAIGLLIPAVGAIWIVGALAAVTVAQAAADVRAQDLEAVE